MTIKEAFEKLHKAVKKSGMNPFFLIGNLKDEFKNIADNIEEGTNVEVEPAQTSGYLVGNVKVNGEDNYLFAPPQVPPLDIYSTEERLVGVFFHDGISEDVYEITKDLSNISTDLTSPTIIMPSSNKILSVKYGGIYTDNGTSYLIDGDYIMVSYQTSGHNFSLYTNKDSSNYTAYRAGFGTVDSLVATYRYTKNN